MAISINSSIDSFILLANASADKKVIIKELEHEIPSIGNSPSITADIPILSAYLLLSSVAAVRSGSAQSPCGFKGGSITCH